jgi:hypothetical protein
VEGSTVAVTQALLFRIGEMGLTCAAYTVEVHTATEHNRGIVRPVADCPNPVDQVIGITGLCTEHARLFLTDPTEG